jgi:type II secretory pathway pseudopilin PulG
MKHQPSGFTLVELTIAIIITTVLGALSIAGYKVAREKAQLATEINATRHLMTAYLGHASDHNGTLLPGYKTDETTTNLDGDLLHYPVNARYPWRLIPDMPKVEGVLLFNGTERALEDENSDYMVSVVPNLGINAVYVGGHFGSGSPLRPSDRMIEAVGKYYVSRISESVRPDKLIVFASARHGTERDEIGHFEVRAPNTIKPEWSAAEFTKNSPPSDHGFVDFRWHGKAVTAMLAGNVELLDEDQLRDMRRWSNQAARANDRNFVVAPR